MQEVIFCYLIAGLHISQCFYKQMAAINKEEILTLVILVTLFWPFATILWVLAKCTQED